jgi:uncharacterized membrane protein
MWIACIAVVFGIVAGMRSMMAPCVVSWAAWIGILSVDATPLAFMGWRYTHIIFTVLAIGELIADKLPSTPSRKTLGPFAARIVSGALCAATIGAAHGVLLVMVVPGAVGAIAGTLGWAEIRAKLAGAFRRDLPAALLEDAVAIALAVLFAQTLR